MKTTIDTALKTLLVDLSRAGYVTDSSCQGKRSPADYKAKRHCDHAFISFEEIPVAIRRKAKRFGLEVWNGNATISPDYEDESRECFMRRNKEFPSAMRALFGLAPANKKGPPPT